MKKHIIDCDKDPLVPYRDWEVKEHKKVGKKPFDSGWAKYRKLWPYLK